MMPEKMNFLLGVGDYFTETLPPPKRKIEKDAPYTLDEAKGRLAPMATAIVADFSTLPTNACPNNEAVAIVTLHPEYLAKTFYPANLLREVGLEAVGSRPVAVKPEKRTLKKAAVELPTTSLYVAGKREAFAALPGRITQVTDRNTWSSDLPKIEALRAQKPADRLKPISSRVDEPLLELVLHAGTRRRYVIEAFEAYARSLGFKLDFDRQFAVGELSFLPARGPRAKISQLAQFTFLRVARPMPRLRPLESIRKTALSFPVTLPKGSPVDPSLHVAIFDGGFPTPSCVDQWVNAYDAPGTGPSVDEYGSGL
jgi:hypothetical protein